MEAEIRTKDRVHQFLELRENLEKERSNLIERVQQIDQVLETPIIETRDQSGIKRSRFPRLRRNEVSLKEAVTKITKVKPRTKAEILRELKAIGYIFSSTTPINSLNATLYAKGQFKNDNGYFSPTN